MIRNVNEFPEEWKTNKNLHWWISRQNGERVLHPDEVYIGEVECVEFAKQYHEEEIEKLQAELQATREKLEKAEKLLIRFVPDERTIQWEHREIEARQYFQDKQKDELK